MILAPRVAEVELERGCDRKDLWIWTPPGGRWAPHPLKDFFFPLRRGIHLRLQHDRVVRLAGPTVAPSQAATRREGDAARVRGTIRAHRPIFATDGPTIVYRRVAIAVGGTILNFDEAISFTLTDGPGEQIEVHPAEGWLLAGQPRLERIGARDVEAIAALPWPSDVSGPIDRWLERFRRPAPILPARASTLAIRDGDRVEAIGVLRPFIDQSSLAPSLREPPTRLALGSGDLLPLILRPL